MSWFNGQILTREEVLEDTKVGVPASHQPGDPCHVYLDEGDGTPFSKPLEGYVVGVTIKGHHQIFMDVALPINDELFVVVNNTRGWVVPPESECAPNGGLVSVSVLEEALKNGDMKLEPKEERRLEAVPSKGASTEDTDETPENDKPSLRVVPPHVEAPPLTTTYVDDEDGTTWPSEVNEDHSEAVGVNTTREQLQAQIAVLDELIEQTSHYRQANPVRGLAGSKADALRQQLNDMDADT